jgi:hypothetical protein
VGYEASCALGGIPALIALATLSMLVCRGGWLETHADG